jgi:hypothetical protein
MVAADDLSLVGMDHHIVDSAAMGIASLDSTTASLPYLDSTILGACHHPLALTVKCNARDIVRVTFASQDRIRIGRSDIVELHCRVASSS